mgnify:CR=1 FL=1
MGRRWDDVRSDINRLPVEALVEIAEHAFGGLYLGHDDEVDPEKEVSGADYVERMAEVLERHGIVPEAGTDKAPSGSGGG